MGGCCDCTGLRISEFTSLDVDASREPPPRWCLVGVPRQLPTRDNVAVSGVEFISSRSTLYWRRLRSVAVCRRADLVSGTLVDNELADDADEDESDDGDVLDEVLDEVGEDKAGELCDSRC